MITLLLTLLLAPASPAAAVTSTQLLADARAHITEITPEKAKSQLEGKAVVLDVREPDEFAAGHLPGAINIPLNRAWAARKAPKHNIP
jgi:3-mercaptopyruvate sulfurtransferase SseA